jgi:hypothetical protein
MQPDGGSVVVVGFGVDDREVAVEADIDLGTVGEPYLDVIAAVIVGHGARRTLSGTCRCGRQLQGAFRCDSGL